MGRWVAAVAQRLADDDRGKIPRIDFRHVTQIASAISVARTPAELDVAPLETWVDRYVIARIPGSRHESE